jgi:hypothetical protein
MRRKTTQVTIHVSFHKRTDLPTALFRHGVKLVTMKCVGKSNWNKYVAKNENDKIKKMPVINKSVA